MRFKLHRYGISCRSLELAAGRKADICEANVYLTTYVFDYGNAHLESVAVSVSVLFDA